MTARLISNASLYRLHLDQGRRDELCDWARANAIDPDEVSADDSMTIEDSPGGRIIRYRVFVTSSGSKVRDPIRSGEALTEERTMPLTVEPPEDWPVYAAPAPA